MVQFFVRKIALETVKTLSATSIGLGIFHTGKYFSSSKSEIESTSTKIETSSIKTESASTKNETSSFKGINIK